MWRKLLISAILVALSAQSVASVPAPPADEHTNVQDDVVPHGRKNLALLALKNYTSLYNLQLLRSRDIVIDVLADPAVSAVNTEGMISERNILDRYVRSAKTAAEARLPPSRTDNEMRFYLTVDKGAIMEHFDSFVRGRNVSKVTGNTDAQNIVWQTLLRHGLEEYVEDATSRWDYFSTRFADDVLQYVNALSPDEREKEKELVEYCESYRLHRDEMTITEFGSKLAHALIVPN